MTFKLLQKIIADNNYNEAENIIVFTQGFGIERPYDFDPKWKCLYKGVNEKCYA